MNTYNAVIIGTEIIIERGIFLQWNSMQSQELNGLIYISLNIPYISGFMISSVTNVTLTHPSYAHKPLKKASAICPGLVVVFWNPVLKFFVFPRHN